MIIAIHQLTQKLAIAAIYDFAMAMKLSNGPLVVPVKT
jgi:hypothetical protein